MSIFFFWDIAFNHPTSYGIRYSDIQPSECVLLCFKIPYGVLERGWKYNIYGRVLTT
jgi:hypothetical protein